MKESKEESGYLDSLSGGSTIKLLQAYSQILRKLRSRGVLRTNNNPVADYAEYLAAEKFELKLAPPSQKSYDAEDLLGNKYQIKGRRIGEKKRALQLGVIRDLETCDFDFLLAVIFNEDFTVNRIYKIPKHIIPTHSKYSTHQRGHILILGGPILEDKNLEIFES